MQLSVVIVNYNVRHFLEQCLLSVANACKGMEAEVFVVDNNSVDGSVEMVREKFPWVKLIANKTNTGFSVANNQAMRVAVGKYILLLNPDTVVEEDTFRKCFDFCESNPDAGGLGVYMIDGSGKFLPESKRGLPTPFVAFCKITGLSAIFPRSAVFGKYHLGFLDKNETHKVDVLSGAFMWMRKETLDKVGLLDEDYFMYGEDIDLSYRITKGGYHNYYYPGTRIIHYKGESTKKSSVNYVIVFYKAMIIFATKHFSRQHARLFSFLIHLAVYARAGLALLNRLFKQVVLPLFDAVMFYAGIMVLKGYWESSVKELNYPPLFVNVVIPAYILIWMVSAYFSGGYDRPLRMSRAVKGVASGTLFILVVYALLPEEYRFSRSLTVLGAVWAGMAVAINRYLLGMTGIHEFRRERSDKKNLIIVGKAEEAARVLSFIRQSDHPVNFLGVVIPENHTADEKKALGDQYLGDLSGLGEIVSVYQVSEIIFCARDITSQEIIGRMLSLSGMDVEYKIAPPESLFIIGSNSDDTRGDLYLVDINALESKEGRRNKRLFDVVSALSMLILFPVSVWFADNKGGFLMNVFRVVFGTRTWVAPGRAAANPGHKPAHQRHGILTPADAVHTVVDASTASRLDMLYVKHYTVSRDLHIMWKARKRLGG